MFNRIKKLFRKQPSSSISVMTVDSEAVNSDNPIKTEADLILRKTVNQEDVSIREINVLLAEKLDVKALRSTVFKIHESLVKHALFGIESVTVVPLENGDIGDLKFKLTEVCYGLNLEVQISAKDFHDTFEPFHLAPELEEGVYK